MKTIDENTCMCSVDEINISFDELRDENQTYKRVIICR